MGIQDIYLKIRNRFTSRIKSDIKDNSLIDMYLYSTAEMINECYEEIENNKDPHIYSNLKGDRIDGVGFLVNCPRYEKESDQNYLLRVLSWTKNNEASNITAINNALSQLKYASNATYVRYTQGTGTATVYIIPVEYDETIIDKAIEEVQLRLSNIVSPDSYIVYKIPDKAGVLLSCYLSATGDINLIKSNIESKVKEYVNNIPIGSSLSYGDINKIGLSESGVKYFSVGSIYINNVPLVALEKMQIVKEKFLYDKIYWDEVTN